MRTDDAAEDDIARQNSSPKDKNEDNMWMELFDQVSIVENKTLFKSQRFPKKNKGHFTTKHNIHQSDPVGGILKSCTPRRCTTLDTKLWMEMLERPRNRRNAVSCKSPNRMPSLICVNDGEQVVDPEKSCFEMPLENSGWQIFEEIDWMK